MLLQINIETVDGPLPVKGPGQWTDEVAAKRAPIVFDAGKDEIVFGRESSCDVVFGADAHMVGRSDSRIYRQPSGYYLIEPLGDHYVEIDGVAADRGQSIADGALLRLGNRQRPLMEQLHLGADKGPLMLVRVREVGAAQSPQDDGKTRGNWGFVSSGKKFRRLWQAVAGVAVVLLVAIVGVTIIMKYVVGAISDIRANQEAVSKKVATTFDEAVVRRIRASAYAVTLDDGTGPPTLIATAWPVRPGLLVTNAHVVDGFALRNHAVVGGRKLFVVKPVDGADAKAQPIPVKRVFVHPGYKAFLAFHEHLVQSSPGFEATFKDLPEPSAYDLALLDVGAGVDLGAALKPASPEEIVQGMTLAYAGYPVEGTAEQRTAAQRPNPSVKFGYVTSVWDFFMQAVQPDHSYLIRHSLPAAGGASGSAIVDSAGNVVAVLSGGTVFTVGGVRQPSAVLENFGQRVDLLTPLLDADKPFDASAESKSWEADLPLFNDYQSKAVCGAIRLLQQAVGPGTSVYQLLHRDGPLEGGAAVAQLLYRDLDVPVKAGHRYSFLAIGTPGYYISLGLFRNGQAEQSGSMSWSFDNFIATAKADETLQLRVFVKKGDPTRFDAYVFSDEFSPAGTIAAAANACAPDPGAG